MAYVTNIDVVADGLDLYNGNYVVERGQVVTFKLHVATWNNEPTPENAYAIIRNNGVDYKSKVDEFGNAEVTFPVNGRPDQVTTSIFALTSGYEGDMPRVMSAIFSDETEIKQTVMNVTASINGEPVSREGVYLERDQVVTVDVKATLSTGKFWEGAQVGVYNNNTEYLGDLDADGYGSVTFQVKGKQGMDTSAIYVFVKDREREATLTVPVKFTNTTVTTETSTEESSTVDTTTGTDGSSTTDTTTAESSTTDSTSSTVDSTESSVESSTEQTVTNEDTSTGSETVETTETFQVAGYTDSASSSTESKEVKETHISTTEPAKELPSTGTELDYGLVGFGSVTLTVVVALVVKKLLNK
ncbi:LPXTG-motif cell wall anchor domain protein [Enterococcus phage EFLK1]|uniref:LPXTG-motif cell wall anchor domain protein n=1 Tax=Enterococcus phage EFLK1 TaxID=1640885 RepID=A0A0E3T963_9CAUD|nr:LPXTG-motif cell wall anchor domain protein [Enterococcus phage EFLK1]AKC05067.1 LPXTG-motif cell wall anchor domain protein [Enterococcus phage EFLK1]